MHGDSINMKVDLYVVVSIACIFVVVSLLILLVDNRRRFAESRTTGLPELVAAHIFFILGTGILSLNAVFDFWISASLVTSAVMGGIFCGYLSIRALLGRPAWRRGWLLCWLVLSAVEAYVAVGMNEIKALLTTSTVINTVLGVYFAWDCWKLARDQRFEGRTLLALPFLVIAGTYFGRLVLMSLNAPRPSLLIATAAITYVLAFSAFVWVFAAISMRAYRLNQRLDWAARHDPLTGLGNRRALAELSRQWPPENWVFLERKVICACIDLDHFKLINDTYGHEVGDFVLETIARRMRGLPQSIEGHMFRIGGDEFLLWQQVKPNTNVERYVGQVLACLCADIHLNESVIRPSVSIGYCDSELASPVDNMIRRADTALYRSKESGRGCFSRHVDEPAPATASATPPAPAPATKSTLRIV